MLPEGATDRGVNVLKIGIGQTCTDKKERPGREERLQIGDHRGMFIREGLVLIAREDDSLRKGQAAVELYDGSAARVVDETDVGIDDDSIRWYPLGIGDGAFKEPIVVCREDDRSRDRGKSTMELARHLNFTYLPFHVREKATATVFPDVPVGNVQGIIIFRIGTDFAGEWHEKLSPAWQTHVLCLGDTGADEQDQRAIAGSLDDLLADTLIVSAPCSYSHVQPFLSHEAIGEIIPFLSG